MIPWLNLGLMVYSSILFLYFYVMSVAPASLANIIGDEAYALCARYRQAAMLFHQSVPFFHGPRARFGHF